VPAGLSPCSCHVRPICLRQGVALAARQAGSDARLPRRSISSARSARSKTAPLVQIAVPPGSCRTRSDTVQPSRAPSVRHRATVPHPVRRAVRVARACHGRVERVADHGAVVERRLIAPRGRGCARRPRRRWRSPSRGFGRRSSKRACDGERADCPNPAGVAGPEMKTPNR